MNTRVGSVLRFYKQVVEEGIARFLREDALKQSAALAYYMIFSLPSILMIILWTAARFYREVTVRDAVFSEIAGVVGKDGAQQLNSTIEALKIHEPTWWASIAGIMVLLVTATTVLVTLRSTLNRLFEVDSRGAEGLGIVKIVYDRIVSTALLATVSFILLVSLVVDALVSALAAFALPWLGPWGAYVTFFDAVALRFTASAALFVIFLRYLPDHRLAWRDVCFGALVTTGLFGVGKHGIGLVIGNSATAGLYEAAGSVLVLMLWVYYGSAMFLFGASLTFTRAKLLGRAGPAVAQDEA